MPRATRIPVLKSFAVTVALVSQLVLLSCRSAEHSAGVRNNPSGQLRQEDWLSRLNIRMVPIPAGEFLMGSPPAEPLRSDSETRHLVRISQPFLMSATDITVAQFSAFVADTGYVTAAEREGFAYGIWNAAGHQWEKHPGASWRNPGFPQTPNDPVVDVNWDDAVAFCHWLSGRENKTYRLPTEAQWEYACRAGTTTAYFWGDDPDAGAGFANGNDHTSKEKFTLFPPFNWSDGFIYTSPVATFRPNAWGLYDMLGNVLQWCDDTYAPYPAEPATDPAPTQGRQRNLRGGAFVYGPKHCRCAFRGRNDATFRNFYIGFRIIQTGI